MDKVASGSSVADEDESLDTEVICLMRVGRNSDWLRLFENTEVTVGRGFDVTYQLLSPSYPLMISRLHCTFIQREDGHWTVTDKKSLNGVWVNGCRIPTEEAHPLKLGDSIQLGVPVGSNMEYDFTLVQRPLREVRHNLAKRPNGGTKVAHIAKKPKRKLVPEEVEPSTSKSKLYRCSSADKSLAQSCPLPPVMHDRHCDHPQTEQTAPHRHMEETILTCGASGAPCDLDNLQTFSQNMLMLREQVDNTERQVAMLEGGPQSTDPYIEEQVKELLRPLKSLCAKMQQMKTLERSFRATVQQPEALRTQQQEELMKKQLEEALQEQKKVMDELAHSRKSFEEIILAKNKELEVTKEEKEKARAQKEEVVTQVTEVLENELQCIICSELFVEAIKSQTRCLALDNCIDSMVENLSLDMKARRKMLVTERKDADSAHVIVIQDEDDSSRNRSSISRSGQDYGHSQQS
ncbi:E3 ubiquitin-protein ligase rnf8 isoform X2 [Dunckerocampus dactyliophorus]|uniref:E3 ubiquitin-protein ligase rnf8 isoform X2 n=1 Tax=Dunckerocampus dactyliophorus TaxID=161453 RepID=UPI002405F7A9|nr:E3 ubiquitin-protein ligase rnf8 isoform X2 [Dunckerocampus dactyliophorus]